MIKHITRQEFFVFWCAALIQSLVWSRFLLSISLWGIVIVALIEIPKGKSAKMNGFQWLLNYLQFWHLQWSPLQRSPIGQYKGQIANVQIAKKAFFALTIPFFIVLLSGLWSENGAYWLGRV